MQQAQEKTSKCPELTTGKQRRRGILGKLLVGVLILLLASVALLSYLLVTERRRNNNKAGEASDRSSNEEDSRHICTTKNCILNAADILPKMDAKVDPCDDFYSYACGGYDKATPIPANTQSIHVLMQLQNDNTEFLKSVIENAKFRDYYSENVPVSKIIRAYDTCLSSYDTNQDSIEQYTALLEKAAGGSHITSINWRSQSYDVYSALIQLKQRVNVDGFFKINVWINPKNNKNYVFRIWPTFLGMQDNSDYVKYQTPMHHKVRHLYKKYMVKMMRNVHNHKSDVKAAMNDVFHLEKRIAEIYLNFSTGNREQTTIEGLSNYSKFDWLSYLRQLTKYINYKPNKEDTILTDSQEMLKHLLRVIKNTDNRTLSNYVAWKVLRDVIAALPERFSQTQQHFLNSIQSRPTEKLDRWRSCIDILSETLPNVLSFLYVDQRFSDQSRDTAFKIFQEIRREFIDNLRDKTWMDSMTKTEASAKAKGIKFLVGFDKNIKSLDKLEQSCSEFHVNTSNFFQTYLNQRSFQFKSQIKKLLKRVKKYSFNDLTSQANAYYSRHENKISFMAGILQRPFYDKGNSRASNYGSVGMFVGHELTHAFDSSGHRYDKDGDLRNWWTEFSLRNFQRKAQCFVRQYNKLTLFGQRVRGEKILGEIIADNGGLKLAYKAYKRSEKIYGKEPQLPGLRLTNDKLFFLSFAQSWCSKYTEDGVKATIKWRLPMMFRVWGTLRNSVDFSKAYQCPVGSKMNPVSKCELW